MNEEEKNQLKALAEKARAVIDDIESMIQDYDACKSETSKKYLGAALLKTATVLKAFQ